MMRVLIISLYVGVTAESSNDDFSCIAGIYTIGQPASVTCHFGPNIDHYHSFEILKYPFDTSGSHFVQDVAICYSLHNEDPSCVIEKGYRLDLKLHNNVTVFIPNVSPGYAGRYACQLYPGGNGKMRLCELHVKEPDAGGNDAVNIPLEVWISAGTAPFLMVMACVVVCKIRRIYLNRHRRRQLEFWSDTKENKGHKRRQLENRPDTKEKKGEKYLAAQESSKLAPDALPTKTVLERVRKGTYGHEETGSPLISDNPEYLDQGAGAEKEEAYERKRKVSTLSEEVEIIAAAKQIAILRKLKNHEFPWDGVYGETEQMNTDCV